MSEETSESGSPIHRYEPRNEGWTPPDLSDSSMEAISAHIETHVGPIANVWHEIVSDLVHIDLFQVAPTEDRPYWTLVTSGMSDLPMTVPAGLEEWAFAELMLCLPGDWKLKQSDFEDERYYWPLRWLKILARFPHEYKTWFCWGHSMPNGDPAEPFHESVAFAGMVLFRPKTVSREFWNLPVREGKVIEFFSVIPLYPGEMELKLRKGAEELEKRLDRIRASEIVTPGRKDVSRSGWRLGW